MEANPLRFLRNLGRSREIATVLLNYGFDDLVARLNLRRYLQWGRRLFFWRKRKEPEVVRTRAERIRLALEELGPTFIKFGQVISTRPDLVPADVIDELSKLQETVPPFPSETAVRMLEEQFSRPVERIFAEFDREPLAAASLGQVHRARLQDGTPVAVKIRRPNVVRHVERDLELMMELATLAERHIPESEAFDPVGLVNHFARTIRRELNYLREGKTIAEFRRLFRNDATLYVPKVYDELTSESVLTMEFIEGYRISQHEEMEAAGISRHEVAANGSRIFMKMAFELGLFHGDPHPGNIRVLEDGSIGLLDYGMVGMLDEEKRELLVDLFLAVVKRDVKSATHVILTLGHPYREIDATLLRADVRDFVENYYGVSLEKLNVAAMLNDFVDILTNHGIRCPPDLMLLIRALVTLEGAGRELDPKFNMAEQLAPFVERVVKERYNPRRVAARVADETRNMLEMAHALPYQFHRALEKLSKDELKFQLDHRGLDRLTTEIDRSSNRVVVGLVLSSIIVALSLIISRGPDSLWFSAPAFVLSFFLGMWLIFGVLRSGSL